MELVLLDRTDQCASECRICVLYAEHNNIHVQTNTNRRRKKICCSI